MSTRPGPSFRRKLPLPGFLAVLLALVSQLALGAVILPDRAPDAGLAALEAAAILCQTGAVDHAPKPVHHAPTCPICPLAVALALPSIIPTPSPVLPRPGDALPLRPNPRAQPRAPPSHSFAAAYPRGPPAVS